MKHILVLAFLSAIVFSKAGAEVKNGKAVPDFTATDSKGETHNLSDYKGKFIVLEWTSNHCPLVKKHYDTNNMQKLQKELSSKGVVWLTIISSAKGKLGYCTPEQANAIVKEKEAAPTAVLIDSDGTVGRLFGAKVTPQMFVIDKEGILRYQGAIDSDNSVDPTTIPDSENYVRSAMKSLLDGQSVAKPVTQAYGCAVKYQAD